MISRSGEEVTARDVLSDEEFADYQAARRDHYPPFRNPLQRNWVDELDYDQDGNWQVQSGVEDGPPW